MIAIRSHDVDVAAVSSAERIREWEEEARGRHESLTRSRQSSIELLSSPDTDLRRLALQSFHYRWKIDDTVFQLVRPIAVCDPDLEIRISAISLLFGIHLRCDRSDREAPRAVWYDVIHFSGQDPDIREYAEMHYRSTDETTIANKLNTPEFTAQPPITTFAAPV